MHRALATTTGFFGAFNRWMDRGTARYEGGVHGVLRRRRRYMIAYAVLVAFVAFAFTKIPTGFLPGPASLNYS